MSPAPASSAAESACASIERPASSCRTLGRAERIRTPSPAASTMVRQRRALALMGRLLSYHGAEARRRRIARSRIGRTRNIAAGDGGFQPRPHAQSAAFRPRAKMRLAAPQKTIYNQLARDGTRRACDAGFSSAGADFSFWLEATPRRAALRGLDSESNE